MDNNVQQNVQDGFLNNLRKDRVNVTIYLMGGVKLTGKIRSFDKFSLVLESGNLEQLIFKHAISTISVPRGSFQHSRPEGSYQQYPSSSGSASSSGSGGPALLPIAAPAGGGSSTPSGSSGTPTTAA